MNPLDLYSGGLDNHERSEFLKHYGIKGMKWKKKKRGMAEDAAGNMIFKAGNRIVDRHGYIAGNKVGNKNLNANWKYSNSGKRVNDGTKQ